MHWSILIRSLHTQPRVVWVEGARAVTTLLGFGLALAEQREGLLQCIVAFDRLQRAVRTGLSPPGLESSLLLVEVALPADQLASQGVHRPAGSRCDVALLVKSL